MLVYFCLKLFQYKSRTKYLTEFHPVSIEKFCYHKNYLMNNIKESLQTAQLLQP